MHVWRRRSVVLHAAFHERTVEPYCNTNLPAPALERVARGVGDELVIIPSRQQRSAGNCIGWAESTSLISLSSSLERLIETQS
jgi:hypothetical protein